MRALIPVLLAACTADRPAWDDPGVMIPLPSGDAASWEEREGGREHTSGGLVVRVDEEGARVRRLGGDVRLRTVGVGRAANLTAPAFGVVQDGPCLDEPVCARPAVRLADGVREWWVARPDGAQVLWQVERRPAGDGALVVELAVDGAGVSGDAGRVWIQPAAGRPLVLDGLRAFDADGKDLPARFVAGDGGARIEVDDAGAVWPVTIDPLLTGGTLTFSEPIGGPGGYGRNVTSGDFNGDGRGDLAVAAIGASVSVPGVVYIYHGYGSGAFPSIPDVTLPTPAGCTGSGFGQGLAVGDVNNDGNDDLAVVKAGASQAECAGDVFVFYGTAAGLVYTPSKSIVADHASTADVDFTVAIPGSVNGDSYDDLVYQSNDSLHVIHGSANGLLATPSTTLLPLGGAGPMRRLPPGRVNVNGDVYADLVVGAPTSAGGGYAYVYHGGPSGLNTLPTSILGGSTPVAHGTAVNGVGDLNGDGFDEVAVSDAAATPGGQVMVYYGSATGIAGAASVLNGDGWAGPGTLGHALDGVVDMTGDGFGDLVVVAGATKRFGLFAGSAGGALPKLGDARRAGVLAVRGTGDLTWDGLGEVFVGSNANVAYLHYGCTDLDLDGECAELTDCDDTNAAIRSGASEKVGNGIDDDCDGGELCLDDRDDDGYVDLSGATRVSSDVDCDDPFEALMSAPRIDCDDARADVNPGAFETPADGVDANCNGEELCYADDDRDGWIVAGAGVMSSADLDCDDPGEGTLARVGDCAEGEPTVHPGASEAVADGVDSDCDGKELCPVDADADGFAAGVVGSSAQLDCRAPGFVPPSAWDCDDGDARFYPGAPDDLDTPVGEDCSGVLRCIADGDGDGYGHATAVLVSADADCDDPGELPGRTAPDCDDADGVIHPGATDRAGDSRDEDCDGALTCYVDGDGDGAATTATGEVVAATCLTPGFSNVAGRDCADDDAAIGPDVAEVPGDGVDQDCDGAELCFVDADEDGWRTDTTTASSDLSCSADALLPASAPAGDCDDGDDKVWPGAPELEADGIDADCDGQEQCFVDEDGDGHAGPRLKLTSALDCSDPGLSNGPATDCDDLVAAVHPGAADDPLTPFAEDCSGVVRCFFDGDGDGHPHPTDTLVSLDDDCDDPGEVATLDAPDCDDDAPGVSPSAEEIVGDGVDQDCDGEELCFVDGDGDGARTDATVASPVVGCDVAGLALASTQAGDCADDDPARRPGLSEIVGDNVDQDCDGRERCWVDGDGDGWSPGGEVLSDDADCFDPGESGAHNELPDCDDGDDARFPGAVEVLGDGVDQDCDGSDSSVSCFADADGDGFRTDVLVLSADADCTDPGEADGTLPGGDCADDDAARFPGAVEVPGDDVDQDCDREELCFGDADGDGVAGVDLVATGEASCAAGGLHNLAGADCDDGDWDVKPGAVEQVADGVDQDCDGEELCIADADGDGLVAEERPVVVSADLDCDDPGERVGVSEVLDCDDGSVDADGDGLDDGVEVAEHGTDPCEFDSDGDGLGDGQEVQRRLDPLSPDTDLGGVGDGEELDRGSNPLDPNDDEDWEGSGGTTTDDDVEYRSGCRDCNATGGPAPGVGIVALAFVLLRRRRAVSPVGQCVASGSLVDGGRRSQQAT